MKVLTRISALGLMVLFLTAGLSYGQSTARQISVIAAEYAAEGKFREAKQEFEEALKVDPFNEALKSYLKLIEDVNEQRINSKTAAIFFEGLGYSYKRQDDQAISNYTRAIDLNPTVATIYRGRGVVYRRKGQYDRAISDYNRAIELNPEFAMAYASRGFAYSYKGQYDLAISDYTRAIKLNPRYAWAYHKRGIGYTNKGEYDKAIADYSRALEINPKLAGAYCDRGIAYAAEENMKKACSDWKHACELGDCRCWGMLNRMRCLGK
jgi:tetratricopeptide (TPR) repeat protein